MTATATYNQPAFPCNYPAHWQLLRIKNLFTEIDERSETGSEELLSVSHYTGVTLKKESLENEDDFITNAESLEGYKRVAKGDLVINIMLAWNGSLGISPFDGITSPAYCVYRVKGNNNPEYFGYLFSTNLMKAEFRKKSTGIIDSRLRLYSDKFFSIFSVVPTVDEQNQIVEYIKAQSQKINHFIANKQRFIELLKEQKQSLINEAVTKGIDKNAKLKDSGIKWLGSIPEHWEIRRLKNVCDVVLGKMLCNEDKGEYSLKPYLKSKNIGWDNVIIEDVENMWFSQKELETYRIKRNDLLVSEGGEVGKTCIWKDELEECYIQNSVHKLTMFENCNPEYYLYWMGMLGYIGHFKEIVNQVSIAHLTRDKIVKVKCLYPPHDEQTKIVQHIKTETAIINKTIAKAEREIELIKEYKEAMIAEAVMGKIEISKSPPVIKPKAKAEPSWEFKEAVLISVLTDKFGSEQFPLGRKRYTKFSYLFHRHTDNKTEGYLKKAAGPYNPKTKYGGPEKIALQNKYITETQSGKLSGFVASDKIQEAKNYFGHYWNADSLNWLEQLRYKKNDELELYATVDKAMVELAVINKSIDLLSVKQLIEENPEWKPKLEREIFNDENVTEAIKFLQQLFV